MAGPRQGKSEQGDVKGARVLIVEARYYDDIADALLAGAMKVLAEAGVEVECVSVPGALEIPAAVAIGLDAAKHNGRPYDGVVALGCVIRGDTIHFEIVSEQSAHGLMHFRWRAPSGRQRHHHGQHRGAGFGPRAPGRTGQGRRCRPRRAVAHRLKRRLAEV